MYDFAAELFPLPRSITGEGTRETLRRIRERLPGLRIHEVPSGTTVFDWEVPPEWNIRDAYVLNEAGQKVIDFQEHNLHVVGYSVPVDLEVTRDELDEHLHSLPDMPDAIPFVTSYYAPRWGFCLAHRDRKRLEDGTYRVVIDSTLEPGSLSYGELILPGREEREILLSTYVCHPSMANNELSGPVVVTELARWLTERTDRRYTYRIVFIPETIGSITYLSRNLEAMRRNTVAGFVVSCVGDERVYSFLESRLGDTLADRVTLQVMRHRVPGFVHYDFFERGSDERQYCSPGADLPVVSVTRSKYREYPEYHTSLDDLSLITPAGLGGTLELYKAILLALERNYTYRTTMPCEPQLGRRGLYPTIHHPGHKRGIKDMMNLIMYSDGHHDLCAVADRIGMPMGWCFEMAETLREHGVLERVEDGSPGPGEPPVASATGS
jgi:aminopeptidase-like protein